MIALIIAPSDQALNSTYAKRSEDKRILYRIA